MEALEEGKLLVEMILRCLGLVTRYPWRTTPRTGQAVRREDAGTFPEVWGYSVCSIVDELGLVGPRVKSVEVSGRS